MAEVTPRNCRTSFLPFHTRHLFLTALIMTALRYCQIMGVDIPLDQGVYCQNGNNTEAFCAKASLYLFLLNVRMDLGLTRVPKYNPV